MNKVLDFIMVEERLRVFKFLLAHPDMTYFIFPLDNAHNYAMEMKRGGGDVRTIDLRFHVTNPGLRMIETWWGRSKTTECVACAGYPTFVKACTALSGDRLGRYRMHRHFITTREHLEQATKDAEVERVKAALYS
jgi:hypothetical protein